MFSISLTHFCVTLISDLTSQHIRFVDFLLSMWMAEHALLLYIPFIYVRPLVSGKPLVGNMKHSNKKKST